MISYDFLLSQFEIEYFGRTPRISKVCCPIPSDSPVRMSTTAPISAFTQLLPTPCYTLATSFRRIANISKFSKSDGLVLEMLWILWACCHLLPFVPFVAICCLSVGESNHVQNQQWWQTHRLGSWGHDLRDQPGARQDFRFLHVFTKEPIRWPNICT